MNKKDIISVLSVIFSIGGIIVGFLESQNNDENMKAMIDKAVEERLKSVQK